MKNACIVGCGAIAPIHANAIKNARFANLYAVCDNNKAVLDNYLDCGANVFYSGFEDALTDNSIDVFHICTPHYLHKDMAVKAMLAGKDVVLEKPAAITRDELNEILKIKAVTGRHVCYMLQNRTNNCIVKLKEIIDTDIYGKPLGIFAALTWNRPAEYYTSSNWKGTFAKEGGSLLSNQAIHMIDLIGYLCNGITGVQADLSVTELNNFIETEDTASLRLRLTNGLTAYVYATNAYSCDEPYRIEFRFENGVVSYTNGHLLYICDSSIEVLTTDNTNVAGKSYWGAGHLSVIEQFYTFLQNGTGYYITLEDGVNSMNAIYAAYRNSDIARKTEFEICETNNL